MKHLYRYFPRQIGVPYRINAMSKKDFYENVNKHNGKRRVFATIFNYVNSSQQQPLLIDKVWFDMDSENGFENLKKLHAWAKENSYKHLLVFSGGGFHFYLLTKNFDDLQNPKFALREVQEFIANTNKLTIGRPDIADIDEHIRGNVAQIATVPNTFNTRRRRYCIPLTEEDLEKGKEHIRQKAKSQAFDFVWYGTELFDISTYDGHPSIGKIEELGIELQDRIGNDVELSRLPPCISAKFLCEYVSFRDRYHMYTWLRDLGYTIKQIETLIVKYWSDIDGGPTAKSLAEYILKRRQINKVFDREDVLAANCETLRMENFCVKKVCKFRNKLYL